VPIIHHHADRDEILARASIEEIAEYAGFKRGRYSKSWHCGFHDDRTPSASIKGKSIRCFGACGRAWDVFGLIEQAHNVDFRGALAWLADHYGVSINRPLTWVERARYQQQRAIADREADDLLLWRNGLLEALRYARDAYFQTYHRAKNYILAHGMDARFGSLAADAGEHYLVSYQKLDRAIKRIEDADWAYLLSYYRATKRAEAA
jgi:hypothetical protein